MTLKTKILISIAALVLAFAVGRFTTPTKTVTQIKTVEVEKKTDKVISDDNKKVHTVTVIKQQPDGTKETTVTQDISSDTKSKDTSSDNTTLNSSSTQVVERGAGALTSLHILVGAPVSLQGIASPVYGLSATRTLLGPISVGVFGFNSGLVGGSIGVTF